MTSLGRTPSIMASTISYLLTILPENNSQVLSKESDRKAPVQLVQVSDHETLGWLHEQRTEQPSLWS